MTANTIATSNESGPQITSKAMLRIIQVAFVVLLIYGIIYNIRVAILSFSFFTEQAEISITNETLANVYPWGVIVARGLITTIFLAVGIIIFIKQHANRIAIITAFYLVSYGLAGISFIYRTPDYTNYIISNNLYTTYILLTILGYILAFVLFHVFPNGNLKPYWGIASLTLTIIVAILWGMPDTNPLHPTNWNISLFAVLYLIQTIAIVTFQRYRYKYIFTSLQRQQGKVVMFGFGISFIVGSSLTVFAQNYPADTVIYHVITLSVDFSIVIIPITLGFAIFRHRLWDIDAVIRRTLIYAVVSALLVLTYFSIVLVTQNLLSDFIPQDNTLLTVVSTLTVVTLFNPVLQRVQSVIDRLFYRKRYDAEATLEQFSERIRDSMDAEMIEQEILKTITDTIQPESISLWVVEERKVGL